MKKDYRRNERDDDYPKSEGRYVHKYASYHRHMRTMNEMRQLKGDEADGIRVRRRRLNIPQFWDDLPISRSYKRSWKDFTKKRHQWEE